MKTKTKHYSTPYPTVDPKLRKLTHNQVSEWLSKEGMTLITPVYENVMSIIEVKCRNGHLWRTNWMGIRAGNYCGECYKDIGPAIEAELLSYGYELIRFGTKMGEGIVAKCQTCGSEKTAACVGEIRKKPGCKACIDKLKSDKAAIRHKDRLAYHGLELIEYGGALGESKIRCMNGHEFIMSYRMSIITSCPTCEKFNSRKLAWASTDFDFVEALPGGIHRVKCRSCKSERMIDFRQRFIRARCSVCNADSIKKTSHDEFVKYAESVGATVHGQYQTVDDKLEISCRHGHRYEVSPYVFRKQKGCKYCLGISMDEAEMARQIEPLGWKLVSQSSQMSILAECVACGSQKTSSLSILKRKKCKCSTSIEIKWTDDAIRSFLSEYNPSLVFLGSKRENYSLRVSLRCLLDNHEWDVGWYDFSHYKRSCPKCVGSLKLTWPEVENRIIECGLTLLTPELGKYTNETELKVKCQKDHEFVTSVHRVRNTGCPYCSRLVSTSRMEKDFYTWASSLGVQVVTSDRTAIHPYEIDIFFPDKKLGVELNGLYYHSTKVKPDIHYHEMKYQMAVEAGVTLLQFWEDEWEVRSDVIKNLVLSRLGFGEKIYARKCKIVEPSKAEVDRFLELHHLLGSTTYSVSVGLRHEDQLVAVLTTRKHRSLDVIEINRFCVIGGKQIVGGFSRMLERLPKPLVTYSDNRYSSGDVYRACGFVLESSLPPSASYAKGMNRVYRVEGDKSAYLQLYDAGKKRWRLD